jgi:hypothetical protein
MANSRGVWHLHKRVAGRLVQSGLMVLPNPYRGLEPAGRSFIQFSPATTVDPLPLESQPPVGMFVLRSSQALASPLKTAHSVGQKT